MIKRLAAILFVLVMAGHVFAGVCGCLGTGITAQHSCCPQEKSIGDSMRAPNCCDTVCMNRGSENGPQYRAEGSAKVTFKPKAEQPFKREWTFRPLVVRTIATNEPLTSHRLKYSRPPDLYLHHHAFLI